MIPHPVAQKLAEKKQIPQLFPTIETPLRRPKSPSTESVCECLWENAIPRKVSTHCLTALDQAPSQKRTSRGWEVEMKVSLMTLLPCDLAGFPGAQDLVSLQRSSAMLQERVGGGKPSDQLWQIKRAHQCWSGMETTRAQWLPFVHQSILSYSRVSLVHESILNYSWVSPFQQWHPTNASQRGREHFVCRSAHILNYLGLCRLQSFQSAALQADASESITFFPTSVPPLPWGCLPLLKCCFL